MSSKERISWIDSAKGILMLCVIAGHTLPLGATSERLIYSFHIPLFVILSGFVMGDLSTADDFFKKVRKSFIQLQIPVLIVFILEAFVFTLQYRWTFSDFFSFLVRKVTLPDGAVWFLNALFWTRFFYLFFMLIKFENILFMLGLACLNLLMMKNNFYSNVFQNLDIVPFFMFFLCLGRKLKKITLTQFLTKHGALSVYISLPLLYLCLHYNLSYFDFGLRIFNGIYFLPLLCFSASFLALFFCMTIDSYSVFRKPLSYIGSHTVLLLSVHALELKFIHLPKEFNSRILMYKTLAERLAIDFSVWAMVLLTVCLYKKIRRRL